MKTKVSRNISLNIFEMYSYRQRKYITINKYKFNGMDNFFDSLVQGVRFLSLLVFLYDVLPLFD